MAGITTLRSGGSKMINAHCRHTLIPRLAILRVSVSLLLFLLSVTRAQPMPTSISPFNAIVFSPAFTLTVSGTGFVAGDQVSWTVGSTENGLPTIFVSSTELQATVASSLLHPFAAAAGVQVGVYNPGVGFPIYTCCFSVCVPGAGVGAMTPNSAVAGSGPLTLTIQGTTFLPQSTVSWNSIPLTATVNSLTQITATVPSSLLQTPGTATVLVNNDPSSNFSLVSPAVPGSFSITPPFAGSLSCLSVPGGAEIQLAMVGGGAGSNYQMFAALAHTGIAPQGSFFGIDLSFMELAQQLGAPLLSGTLDATGSATHLIPLPGLSCPTGIVADIVSFELDPVFGTILEVDIAHTVLL